MIPTKISDFDKGYVDGKVTIRHILSEGVEFFQDRTLEELRDLAHDVQLWLYQKLGIDGHIWRFTRPSVIKFMKRRRTWNRIYDRAEVPRQKGMFNPDRKHKVVNRLVALGVDRSRAEAIWEEVVRK